MHVLICSTCLLWVIAQPLAQLVLQQFSNLLVSRSLVGQLLGQTAVQFLLVVFVVAQGHVPLAPNLR